MKLAINAVVLVTVVMPVFSFAQTSTFHLSCTNIRISTDGTTIEAKCLKRDRKTLVNTSLRVRGIVNKDGKLVFERGVPSNHDKSCDTFGLYVPQMQRSVAEATKLIAVCKNNIGKRINTVLELPAIENDDGNLRQR